MEECRYRKMICSAGHESRVFSEGEILPRRCSVCGQPYDRRYNRPVLCYRDGSTPDTEVNDDRKQNYEIKIREERNDDSSLTETVPVRSPRRGRGRAVSTADTVCDSYSERTVYHTENSMHIGLFNGGDYLSVPEQGGYLGREEIGQDLFGMNPLISRKHAFIRADRFGKIQIKDEGSLNGTFIDDGNGKRKLRPYETAELKVGNTIWLANHILAIEEIK